MSALQVSAETYRGMLERAEKRLAEAREMVAKPRGYFDVPSGMHAYQVPSRAEWEWALRTAERDREYCLRHLGEGPR